MSLQIRFKRWIDLFIFLPPLLLLLMINVIVWRTLKQEHDERLNGTNDAVRNEFYFGETAWWALARSGKSGTAVSDGISEDGHIGMALSIWSPDLSNVLKPTFPTPQRELT